MANNDVHFSISCDSSNASYSINNVYKQLDTLYDKSNRVGKNISKNNADAIGVINEQYQHVNKSDTIKRASNSVEAFGRQIKALRIHGLDPTTNSFARFINVAGGSFFNVFTLGVTAIMGVVVALKQVNKYLQEFYAAIAARADTLIKMSKASIDNLDKQKKQIQGIVDQLQKLNQKQQLTNREQALAVSLAQELKNKWSGVNVQIDKATGRITNLNQIQARLNRQNISRTSAELQQIIQQQNTKLDLQLSKYTGKTSLFKGIMNGKNPFESYQIFRGKQAGDIDIFDLFPGLINNFDDKEAVRKIDINKLIFGNTESQISFFRQVASHLTNIDAFNELNQVIDTLYQKLENQKQLSQVADPTKEIRRKVDDLNKTIQKSNQIEQSIYQIDQERLRDNLQNRNKTLYDQGSTDYKIASAKNDLSNFNNVFEQLKKEVGEVVNAWKSNPDWYEDKQTGTRRSRKIDQIVRKNQNLAQLYSQYLNIDKEFQPKIDNLIQQVAKYEYNKKIVDDYYKTTTGSGRFRPPMTQQQLEANQYIKSFAPDFYDVAWEGLSKQIKEAKAKAREQLNLSTNDEADMKVLDDVMTELTNENIRLKEAEEKMKQVAKLNKDIHAIQKQLFDLDKQQKEQWIKELDDEYSELAEEVRQYEQRRKEIRKQQEYVDSFAKNILGKYYQDNGMQMLWRRKELQRQWKQQLGVQSLTDNQKNLIGRLAYIEQLQKAGELNQNDTFKYGVKSNDLAARGGWNSSVYVSGKDNVMQQNLKTNQNQQKILQQINKVMPELKREIETLNSNLKI